MGFSAIPWLVGVGRVRVLATISPYITHVIRRFGNWILSPTPPKGCG
ncbi:hypothetical protein [Nonomuraea sp. NPDC005650]